MLKYKSVVGLDRQRWKKETTRKQNARRILLRSALQKKKRGDKVLSHELAEVTQ